MHDQYNAGRFWLATDSKGEQVEEAISTFLKHAGHEPQQVVKNMPHFVKLRRIEDYPAAVQVRLKLHGLEEAIKKKYQECGSLSGPR